MVADNPLFRGRWTFKRFNAMVINDIWPEVLFFSLIATMVSLVSEKTKHSLAIPNGLLTVLGTVLGLVISFRTSSAYERYQDGRKMWTNISVTSRNLAQLIWIHVPFDRTTKDSQGKMTTAQSVIEKKSMVNLVQGFSVSVKHFLRGEPGVYYQDLYPLICFLPRYAPGAQSEADMLPLWSASEDDEHPLSTAHPVSGTLASHRSASDPGYTRDNTLTGSDAKSERSWFPSLGRKSSRPLRQKAFDPEKALASVPAHRPLKPARNPPKTTIYDYIPFLRFFKWLGTHAFRRNANARPSLRRKKRPDAIDSNVPFEITLFLSNYIGFCMRNGWLQPAVASAMVTAISSLQDTVGNLERIGNTPLPFAYQAHLRMSLWLYLFFLPFQIFSTFKYLTIPGTAFASFLLLGFLEIGQEIENPFNYDLNDLDLDSFCLSIERDLHEVTAHIAQDPQAFIFSAWNQPFAPTDRRTAAELTKDAQEDYKHADHGDIEPGMASIRRILLANWRDVDVITRHP